MKNNFNNKILAISLGILMMTPFITHARKFFGTETGEIGVNELASGKVASESYYSYNLCF